MEHSIRTMKRIHEDEVPMGIVVADDRVPGSVVPVAPVVASIPPNGSAAFTDNSRRLSANDVAGCWCTLPLMGAHCYGLQAIDDDTLVENPPECLFGMPLPPCIGHLCCFGIDCAAKRFVRQGTSNVFKSHSEGLILKFYSENKMTR